MNTPRIESALKEIEASLPDGEAKVRFDVYGGGVDESFIRGSRAGIARLGVRLIRAAIGEERRKSVNGEAEVSGALDDVIHSNSDERPFKGQTENGCVTALFAEARSCGVALFGR